MAKLRGPTAGAAADDRRLVEWEREQLLELGLSRPSALRLAEAGVSHHAAAALLRQGCSPRLAARILAPLPTQPTPTPSA